MPDLVPTVMQNGNLGSGRGIADLNSVGTKGLDFGKPFQVGECYVKGNGHARGTKSINQFKPLAFYFGQVFRNIVALREAPGPFQAGPCAGALGPRIRVSTYSRLAARFRFWSTARIVATTLALSSYLLGRHNLRLR